MPLILGDVIFEDYEIPEKIAGLGGKQELAKHVLLGGARIVDAMGPSDADPAWSGRFTGSQATARAQQLDTMRRAGLQMPLSFGEFFYTVAIEEFDFDFERPYQIPYHIKLYVISFDDGGVDPSLDDLVTSDLGSFSDEVSAFDEVA